MSHAIGPSSDHEDDESVVRSPEYVRDWLRAGLLSSIPIGYVVLHGLLVVRGDVQAFYVLLQGLDLPVALINITIYVALPAGPILYLTYLGEFAPRSSALARSIIIVTLLSLPILLLAAWTLAAAYAFVLFTLVLTTCLAVRFGKRTSHPSLIQPVCFAGVASLLFMVNAPAWYPREQVKQENGTVTLGQVILVEDVSLTILRLADGKIVRLPSGSVVDRQVCDSSWRLTFPSRSQVPSLLAKVLFQPAEANLGCDAEGGGRSLTPGD